MIRFNTDKEGQLHIVALYQPPPSINNTRTVEMRVSFQRIFIEIQGAQGHIFGIIHRDISLINPEELLEFLKLKDLWILEIGTHSFLVSQETAEAVSYS